MAPEHCRFAVALQGAFELTGPTISHHLKVLRVAGLIAGERRGTWMYYRIEPQLLTYLYGVLVPSDTRTVPA